MSTKQNKVANILQDLTTENCVLTLEANAKTSVASTICIPDHIFVRYGMSFSIWYK